MELAQRARGDEFAQPGRLAELTRRIAARPGVGDTPVACFYGFDPRTRSLPFLFYDRRMVPAGLRAIASAFYEAGFKKTRAIFQIWSPNIRPSNCRIDGDPLQVLAITAMQIHAAPNYAWIEDAWSMGADRPLILVGGPKAIFEPDHLFGLGPNGDIHADAAATGEELILLELLDRITEHRGSGETMLQAFTRCRDDGLLEDIPGLVYLGKERDRDGRLVLIDTGIQRLVRDLDELPHPAIGFRLLEPPHKRTTLAPQPLAQDQVHKYSMTASMVITHGCKFSCDFCPIPAYSQRTWRFKSPERLVDEFKVLREAFNISHFFGTDDNFFNRRETVEGIFEALARTSFRDPTNGRVKKAERRIRLGTEATEFDVYKCRDLLPLAHEAGLKGIWLGIEDLAARLVKKGQTPAKTVELFRLLDENEILPMAMLIHHDGQPLRTGGNDLYGILNQAAFLYRHGAASMQCSLHAPCQGTKEYDRAFGSGIVIKSFDGEPLPECYYDGSHIVATSEPNPVQKQLNMFAAYARFYNPLHLAKQVVRSTKRNPLKDKRVQLQILGMASLAVTVFKSIGWLRKQSRARIEYWQGPPEPKFTIRRLDEERNAHPQLAPASPLTAGAQSAAV